MTDYRVLVTGSREWGDRAAIRDAMHAIEGNVEQADTLTLVHGDARGADRIAEELAMDMGWGIESHPADWNRYGKRAGFVRNSEMVSLGASVCLAFIKDNSKGATMCANLAREAGIPVTTCESSENPDA